MKRWLWRPNVFHPNDDALIAQAAGASLDEAVDGHVGRCARCSTRVRAYTRAWRQVDAELRAEADAEFTEARLGRQYASIMRRLAQHGRPARVLAFPGRIRPPLASRHGARRWVAAAAVVGLLVGMAAGRFIDDSPVTRQLARSSVRPPASPTAQSGTELPLEARQTKGSDEAFLVELEVAAATPRIEPLLALDAMTPRLREAVGSGR